MTISCRKDDDGCWKCRKCHNLANSEASEYFLEDATYLAYEAIHLDALNPANHEVQIHRPTFDKVLGDLFVIHEAARDTNHVLHDMIFKYQVHLNSDYGLNTLNVSLTTAAYNDYMGKKGESNTEQLNDLTNIYDFSLTSHYATDYPFPFHELTFTSETDYNIDAFEDMLKISEDVMNVNVYNYAYDIEGTDITPLFVTDTERAYEFSYGWENCDLLSCEKYHFWKVEVDDKCNITSVEEYGDELPE